MTDKEKKIAEDNHDLIYKYMNKHHLDEDCYLILAETLCKAVMSFDENNKYHASLFTYIWKCFNNAMINHHRFINKSKRKKPEDLQFVNLDQIIFTEDSEDSFKKEIIGKNDINFINYETTEIMEELISMLTRREREVFNDLINGYSLIEISKKDCVSHQSISEIRRKIGKKYQKIIKEA